MTEETKTEFCRDCKFWDGHQSRSEIARCRINPPTIEFESFLGARGAWPVTESEDWCGKFEARTELDMWAEDDAQ